MSFKYTQNISLKQLQVSLMCIEYFGYDLYKGWIWIRFLSAFFFWSSKWTLKCNFKIFNFLTAKKVCDIVHTIFFARRILQHYITWVVVVIMYRGEPTHNNISCHLLCTSSFKICHSFISIFSNSLSLLKRGT